MNDNTLSYYENEAVKVAANYRTVDFDEVRNRITRHFKPAGHILELGSGSGRDADIFLNAGFEVTALDGSAEMVRQAIEHYPALRGKAKVHLLPDPLKFPDGSFDAVYAMAIIMHLNRNVIPGVFKDVARVLKSGGHFACSVNTARPGLNENDFDERNRRFTVYSLTEWSAMLCEAGFSISEAWESLDVTGRNGIAWATIIAVKG